MRFIFWVFVLSVTINCGVHKKKQVQKHPNFILILSDDQGWNGTSVQMMANEILSKSDYHETPNLEKLAARGMRFSNGYSAAPVCAPSRYAIQFGQTPARLKMIRVGMNTSHINHDTELTIPKLLKSINPNYTSAHFGKWGIGGSPSQFGYTESDGATKNKDGGFDYRLHKEQWDNSISDDPKKMFSITNRAIDFMEKQVDAKQPFFLQISHYAVHSDIMMLKQTLKKYQNKEKGKYQKHDGFAAMTEDLDSSLGLLLERVKTLGIEDNTYIIYTSDNGAVPNMPPRRFYETSTNYPLSRGKWDAMEGGVRVPFIVAGPKIKANIMSNTIVSGIDILPTIIDLANNKVPFSRQIDGASFKEVLLNNGIGKVNRNSKGLIFHVPYENGIALKRAHSAIIIDQYKLIKFYDTNELMLFDIENDLSESRNLTLEFPNKTNSLEKILDDYLSKVKAPKWQEGITWKHRPIKKINSFH